MDSYGNLSGEGILSMPCKEAATERFMAVSDDRSSSQIFHANFRYNLRFIFTRIQRRTGLRAFRILSWMHTESKPRINSRCPNSDNSEGSDTVATSTSTNFKYFVLIKLSVIPEIFSTGNFDKTSDAQQQIPTRSLYPII